ncbi:unannotated protein [freshwater metagenome]|uniref:Unannotated protein n=1 Tax=freshwater metagenome TaxID=449393 RepID=A0A6J6U1R8_9ZZZZ|nr:hypothetical protein [Actinomycetota bacterium]MTA62891.1 hypothetical protein [Actinomycetota bacterium]
MQQRGEKGLWALAIGVSAIAGFAIAGFPGIRSEGVVALPTTTIEPSATTSTTASSTTAPSSTTTSPAPIVVVKSPSELTVRVANGTRVSGAAGKVSDRLSELGYTTRTPTDAKTNDVSATAVYFSAPFNAEAESLAKSLGLDPAAVMPLTDPPAIDPDGAELVVIVGTDQGG